MDVHSFHVIKYSKGWIFENSDLSSVNLVTMKVISHYYFNQFNQTYLIPLWMDNFFLKVQFLKTLKAFWRPPKSVWSWLYSNGDSNELWLWTFIHIRWTLQYASERMLFPRLLEGLICSSFILKWWEEVVCVEPLPPC